MSSGGRSARYAAVPSGRLSEESDDFDFDQDIEAYPPRSRAPPDEVRSSAPFPYCCPQLFSRRRLAIFLAIVLGIVWAQNFPAYLDSYRIKKKLANYTGPPTRVGPRDFANLYGDANSSCTSAGMLDSLKRATIREDGRSRSAYDPSREVAKDSPPPLETFEFSFDLPDCPPLHVFTAEEACDLIDAFGGVYISGDSLQRQFAQGLFLLLSSSFNLLMPKASRRPDFRGNNFFLKSREAKHYSIFDSRKVQGLSCDGAVLYSQVWLYAPTPAKMPGRIPPGQKAPSPARAIPLLLNALHSFVASLPKRSQRLSTLFVHSTGMHYNWNETLSYTYHIEPMQQLFSSFPHGTPRPIGMWSMNPAPGANKPKDQLATQGPGPTKDYNERMQAVLDQVNAKSGLQGKQVWEGAWGALDWYGVTDGAKSYDGTHYDYQVAMERAQVMLNWMDLVWGEVVDAGGMWDEPEESSWW